MENNVKITSITIPHHNREVYGTLYEPDGVERYPIVIFSHGFNGSGTHFTDHANLLANKGIASITFDFCGGAATYKGSMKSTEMTIFTEQEDLEAVIEYAVCMKCVDSRNLFLFGASQGGLVTALTASQYKYIPAGVLLLYPALCIPDDWDKIFPMVTDIPETCELWGVQLGRRYFEVIHGFSVYDHIRNYQGPVLVMHGEKDSVVDIEYSRKLLDVYPDIRLEIFAGEGHGFTKVGDKRVAEMTLDFVDRLRKE